MFLVEEVKLPFGSFLFISFRPFQPSSLSLNKAHTSL